MLWFAIGLVVGFAAGMLVYRRNKKHSEALIQQLKNKIEDMTKG